MATLEQASIPLLGSLDASIEHGNFAQDPAGHVPSKIVLATFNIRYAVGSHLISGSLLRRLGLGMPRRRHALVSRNIQRAVEFMSAGLRMPRIDILAIQEADKQTRRAGGVHIAREMSRALRMHYAHASVNIPRGNEQKPKQWYLDFEEHIASDDPGDAGLAILSRFPLRKTKRLDLPWTDCAWRPRLAIESLVSIGSRNLQIYNAHLDPHASTDEQLEQHRVILACAEKAGSPAVILGDFNTLTVEARLRMRDLLETHGYSTPFRNGVATWRSGLIRLQPDWIFVRDLKMVRWGVARGLSVSDHWPVWVEIVMNDQDYDVR